GVGFARGRQWRAMAEVPQELPVARELLDAVAATRPGDPDVVLLVDDDSVDLVVARPPGMMPGAAPRLQQVALRVELEDLGRRDTAVAARRRRARHAFVGPEVARPA